MTITGEGHAGHSEAVVSNTDESSDQTAGTPSDDRPHLSMENLASTTESPPFNGSANPSPTEGIALTNPDTDTPEDSSVLDYSSTKEDTSRAQVLTLTPYDPRPHEDGARRTIAYLLIWLLWLIVGALLILVAFQSIAVADLKEFAVVLGPVVTLVSAATGFYYGTKSQR